MNAVILAGGVGKRLWPMSRKARPKQFADVLGRDPLIVETHRRLLRLLPQEKIYFSVTPGYLPLLRETFPEVDERQIIVEPEKRDTGPAMGYVALKLRARAPDEPFVFVPCDHFIGDEEKFLRCLQVGERLTRETGKLVDIGVAPAFASTTLGYTRVGQKFGSVDGVDVFHFAGHVEKPAYEAAREFVQSGDYLWHANYYLWTPRGFWDAIVRSAPDMAAALQGTLDGTFDYAEISPISFDYAVTEHLAPGEMLVIRGDFGWSDVGSWDHVYDRLSEGSETTEGGNVTRGSCVLLETDGSLVYGQPEKVVAVLGMKDVVVVDTPDALLVCRRGDGQRIKELLDHLSANGASSVL